MANLTPYCSKTAKSFFSEKSNFFLHLWTNFIGPFRFMEDQNCKHKLHKHVISKPFRKWLTNGAVANGVGGMTWGDSISWTGANNWGAWLRNLSCDGGKFRFGGVSGISWNDPLNDVDRPLWYGFFHASHFVIAEAKIVTYPVRILRLHPLCWAQFIYKF